MSRNRKWIPRSKRIAQEIKFLGAFYDLDSPTYQDGKASAIEAGYKDKTASRVAENLLEKYRDFDFKAIAEKMGIDRISIGLALKKIVQGSGAPRDVLSAARLLLANMGEITDGASSQKAPVVNVPVMIIQGATPERIAALRSGGAPNIAETEADARELPPPSEQDVIEVEAVTEGPATQPTPVEAAPRAEDTRRLKPGDFAGPNRGDVGSLRQK